MPFVCSFSGQCEKGYYGYNTLAECQKRCQAYESKDVMYEIMSNTPHEAQALAPSDQSEVIWRLWGMRVPPVEVVDILEKIRDVWSAWEIRELYPVLRDYIDSLHDPVELIYHRIWQLIEPATTVESGHDDFKKKRGIQIRL
jgi:hypothetical protein